MQILERREKILEIIHKKGPLSYEEILDMTSTLEDPIDILSDIDTLVFFRFLQHTKPRGELKLQPTTLLELRPRTKTQMENIPSEIVSRLKKLDGEIPPWYRKWAILTVLSRRMRVDEIFEKVRNQYPSVRWFSLLVEASLGILKESNYVLREKQKGIVTYTRDSNGESLLKEPLIQQFFALRKLKDEFTSEFRIFEILKLLIKFDQSGISSGEIVRHLQSKYGIRGNKRRAIRNTLNNMIFSGLLEAIGGTKKRGGHVYYLSRTAESLLLEKEDAVYIQREETVYTERFKEIVEQFFENYITGIKRDIQSSVIKVLEDLEQCKGDLSLQSTTIWEGHIALLSSYIQNEKADAWEKKMFQCIVACILSRLLPSEISIEMLRDYRPPYPYSEVEHPFYISIAREYYFNLTKVHLSLGENEKAFQSFDILKLLSWESFESLILEGIIEMKKGNIHKTLDIFGKALKIARGNERIVALLHMGLAYYQRNYFEEARKTWSQCLDLECTFSQKTTLHHNLANVYRLLRKLEKARKNYEYCIALVENVPEREEFKFKSLIGLANVLIDLCSWDKAEEILREVIQECTERFLPMAAIAMTNLGVLLGRKKKYEEALTYHKEALELVDKEHNSQEYGIILHNMGNVLRQLRMLDEALAVLKEALELIGDENMWLLQAIEISLADSYIEIGNLDEGWKLSQSVLQDRWLDNRRAEAEAWRIRGKILLRKNEFRRAKELLIRSERIFREYELNYEIIDVFRLLEECYKGLGDESQLIYYENEKKILIQKIGLPK